MWSVPPNGVVIARWCYFVPYVLLCSTILKYSSDNSHFLSIAYLEGGVFTRLLTWRAARSHSALHAGNSASTYYRPFCFGEYSHMCWRYNTLFWNYYWFCWSPAFDSIKAMNRRREERADVKEDAAACCQTLTFVFPLPLFVVCALLKLPKESVSCC